MARHGCSGCSRAGASSSYPAHPLLLISSPGTKGQLSRFRGLERFPRRLRDDPTLKSPKLGIVDRSQDRNKIWIIARADDSVTMSICQNLEMLLCQCTFWRNVVGQYHLSRICKVLYWFTEVSIIKVLFSTIYLKMYLLVSVHNTVCLFICLFLFTVTR